MLSEGSASSDGERPLLDLLHEGRIALRRPDVRLARELRIFAADRFTAAATRDALDRLCREHDAFRGQVLSFDVTEYEGNELVSFLPRAALTREDVVLPDGVLDAIEAHVVRSAEVTEHLLRLGQHLKRGVLLHGPAVINGSILKLTCSRR